MFMLWFLLFFFSFLEVRLASHFCNILHLLWLVFLQILVLHGNATRGCQLSVFSCFCCPHFILGTAGCFGTSSFKEEFPVVKPSKGAFTSCASCKELRTVIELNSVQCIQIRKRDLLYLGNKYLGQLVTDSNLLVIGKQVPHCNCSAVLFEGNELGQNSRSCEEEVFWLLC